mgnify:CR=1 FL=1|tara:strand:+ start:811 stop:1542 length:732 start_codon:yes stop_codon:yes gene_type:complete
MSNTEKKETSIKTIKNVTFMYTSVTRAVKQLNQDNKPAPSDDPLEFFGYEVKVLVKEKVYKALKKNFKGAKNLPNAKEFTPEEVVEKFGLDEPEDDMVLIKFTQSALVGKPLKGENGKTTRKASRPIKQIGVKGQVQDITGQTVDQDTNLANGSKGHFQFRPVETEFGLYLYPHLVCITELIEYTGGEDEEDLDSLGLEELDESDLDQINAEEAKEDKADERSEPKKAVEEAPKEDDFPDIDF